MGNLKELDIVVLVRDHVEYALKKGDMGTIVHLYSEGEAAEVEFVTGSGKTVAVAFLEESEFRPLGSGEILHAREVSGDFGSFS